MPATKGKGDVRIRRLVLVITKFWISVGVEHRDIAITDGDLDLSGVVQLLYLVIQYWSARSTSLELALVADMLSRGVSFLGNPV